MANSTYTVLSFYKFTPLSPSGLVRLREGLESLAAQTKLCGLVILAGEGINSTVACPPDAAEVVRSTIRLLLASDQLEFKEHSANRNPFRRFDIKLRKEIVTSGYTTDILAQVVDPSAHELSPGDWQSRLTSGDDIILLDVRNRYETQIGKFKDALDPGTDNFQEFTGFIRDSEIPKSKPILMYCTGGIRCEKALALMQHEGFQNVRTLQGGILNYLKHFPDSQFEGECFVFDHRVALNQKLEPSGNYSLCPHCGQPATVQLNCRYCDKPAVVCAECTKETERNTCSLNCAYHAKRGSRYTKRSAKPKAIRNDATV